MADVYLAQDRRAAATTAIADADALAAEAIGRLMAEGLVLAQVVELTEMPSRHVQRLRSAVDAAPGPAAKPAVNRNSGEPVSLAAGPSKGVDGADTPPPGAVSSGVS